MARITALRRHLATALILFAGLGLEAPAMGVDAVGGHHEVTSGVDSPLRPRINAEPVVPALSADQQALVDFAVGRFEAQGLKLPEITFEFFSTTLDCDGHKGMYWHAERTLRMCSMDEHTLLHETAHAWANENLTAADREAFTRHSGLRAWNDHDDAWEERGTEHAAETIAWALGAESNHVRWVETLADGSEQVSHRILTLGLDVGRLWDNFERLTGVEPVFRDAGEWSHDPTAGSVSPEAQRRAASG